MGWPVILEVEDCLLVVVDIGGDFLAMEVKTPWLSRPERHAKKYCVKSANAACQPILGPFYEECHSREL